VDWAHVSVRLNNLLANTQYQMSHAIFEADELAVRFHHQLVWIHPFPNGNGRHARLLADTLVVRLGRKRFSWGAHSLLTGGVLRQQYLEALRAADIGEYERLLAFARC
jgi:fido (protein-threonine AMPylation protein)